MKQPSLQSQISEEAFLGQVIGLARWNKWRVAHFRPAMTKRGTWVTAVQGDGKGFFDLVLVRSPRVIFAELKSINGKPSNDQLAWSDACKDTPLEVYLWKPEQIEDIEKILK